MKGTYTPPWRGDDFPYSLLTECMALSDGGTREFYAVPCSRKSISLCRKSLTNPSIGNVEAPDFYGSSLCAP